ncbi:hypothetical protein [Rothia aeria]|uniref:hypothetical protein n=1 Tax=Rothia aeria TaxID=172042 RepID=UPI00241DED74|nr:hypothetical protein [Rothia aeria]
MSDKNNIKYYEKIIILEDEIYDSDALDNYDAFILNCIKFAEKNIVPLSQYRKELEGIIKQCIDFLEGRIGKSELEKYYIQLGRKIRLSGTLDKKEKEIHIFMSVFLDSNFLQNTAPEEQQDSDICYLLCNLYRIKDDLELCNKFYNFICK